MVFYGSGIFYGNGAKYAGTASSAAQSIPVDLRFYRTNQDGIYVFWWGFDPAFITPTLAFTNFDLQLDTEVTFASPNLVTYTTATAITYQNGNVRKGFAVPVAARIDSLPQIWYARVRTHTISFTSAWSQILPWTIPPRVQTAYAVSLMESLPDYHVYGKGDLLLPVNQRDSNLYVVEDMYGYELDIVYYTNFLTQTNNYIDLALDEVLYSIYGVQFNFIKPENMQYVDYRWILMNLYLASLVGSTNEAIILTVQSYTGIPPTLLNIRDLNDFFLNTVLDAPITPGSPQSTFNTVYSYIESTFRLQNITTGLYVPLSAYSVNGVLGTWTMNVPTTNTLQAIYNTGTINDPFPIVFDALAGSTTLAGTVTFTNNSTAIVGVGTLFSTQLALGQQITNSEGIYLGTVGQIVDDTNLVLVNVWAGVTQISAVRRLLYSDLQLPPPVLWDSSTLKAGLLVIIYNPLNINIEWLKLLVMLLLPAEVKVYFRVVQ